MKGKAMKQNRETAFQHDTRANRGQREVTVVGLGEGLEGKDSGELHGGERQE